MKQQVHKGDENEEIHVDSNNDVSDLDNHVDEFVDKEHDEVVVEKIRSVQNEKLLTNASDPSNRKK